MIDLIKGTWFLIVLDIIVKLLSGEIKFFVKKEMDI